MEKTEPFNRSYQQISEELGRLTVGTLEVTLPHHGFWGKFAKGWEPDTEKIYRTHAGSGSRVLDIGAWIGPTILFAAASGASRIDAFEPNPQSIESLQTLLQLNPSLKDIVTLFPNAVSNKNETLSMGLPENESDTSMSGLSGNDFKVESLSFIDLLEQHQRIDLLKVDIEGAEVLLSEGFKYLSKRTGQVVHLSLHKPFFPQGADLLAFIEALQNYQIEDDRGTPLSHPELSQRLLSDESHPEWGTQHGNFFELLLVAKG